MVDQADSATVVPEQVKSFRDSYRNTEIPRGYSPILHILFTFGGGSAALIWSVAQLSSVQAMEWLTLPIAFLYANLAEYFGHRFPMHHPYRGLKLLYKRHAGQHHRYFTEQSMPLREMIDLRAVLFPPLLVIFFFGAFALPVWLVLREVASPNVAWLFVITGLGYYLNYELLHLLHHAPANWRIGKTRLMRSWSALHRTHHDPKQMAHCNFNITYPIGDVLFGTWRRGASAANREDKLG